MARGTVVINGKVFDVATGRQIDCGTKKKPVLRTKHAKNTSRKPKTSSASSRATYQKPVAVAKPEHNVASGVVPAAAIAPNPVVVAKPEPKPSPSKKKNPRKKLIIEIIIAILIIVFVGIISALYLPSFSVRMASSNAGVDGRYPTYQAEGFSIDGGVKSEPGEITINYRNNGNGNTYSISQRSSNWDSNGLLENKVKLNSTTYDTLTQRGLTIFQYDNITTWVNGGIVYTITDDTGMDVNQILQIIDGI